MDFEQAGVACRRDRSLALRSSYLPKAPMGEVISFAVKTLPFADIAVGTLLFRYHVNVQNSLRESIRKAA